MAIDRILFPFNRNDQGSSIKWDVRFGHHGINDSESIPINNLVGILIGFDEHVMGRLPIPCSQELIHASNPHQSVEPLETS
ncbi:hypothetical protein D3C72_2371310 [compost metagenome]